MEWLVSAGLLVALAAWVAGVCHRLQVLRAEVRGAWADWLADARRRNETLEVFAESVSLHLPPGEMLPRTLRRLVADSERRLRFGEMLLWAADEECTQTEKKLQREAHAATLCVERRAELCSDETLRKLSERLSGELQRQEQSARRYSLAAESYNAALREPPIQLIAPGLGFRYILWSFPTTPSQE